MRCIVSRYRRIKAGYRLFDGAGLRHDRLNRHDFNLKQATTEMRKKLAKVFVGL
jgi:hypothetical protein